MVELLSIVVVNHDQSEHLTRLLRQLRALEIAREIVVVDLGSKDDSLTRAQALADHVYEWKGSKPCRRNHGWAYGITRAEFDWVICLDAGAVLSEAYLHFLSTGAFRQKAEKLVAWLPNPAGQDNQSRLDAVRSLAFPWQQMGLAYHGALFRKAACLKVGNWNSGLDVDATFDVLWRLSDLGAVQLMPAGASLVVKTPQAQDTGLRRRCLFWQDLGQGRGDRLLRRIPWAWALSLATWALLTVHEPWVLVFWWLTMIGMSWRLGFSEVYKQALSWIYWIVPAFRPKFQFESRSTKSSWH